MTTEARPSRTGASQLMAEEDAEERDHEAEQRRGVLEEDGEQARVLAVVDRAKRAPRALGSCGRRFQATLNERLSKTIASASTM